MDKKWIWGGVLLVLLLCCCLAAMSGGLAVYFVSSRQRVAEPEVENTPRVFSEEPCAELDAHWSFDHCDGKDETGDGYEGILYGNPECVDGVVGKAIKMDGVDDWFSLESVPPEIYSLKDFSIALWFNTDQDMTQTLLQGNDGHAWGLRGLGIVVRSLYDIEALYRVQGSSKCEMHASVDLEPNTWHHVVLIRDTEKQEGQLFVDGSLADSCQDPDPHLFLRPQSYPRIGYGFYAPGDYEKYFSGIIDEVHLYHRALAAEEITALFEIQD